MQKPDEPHLLTMLAQEVDPPTIQAQIDHGWKDYPKGFVAFLQKGDVPAGGKGLAEYLAKYVTSPPISVRRIERYDDQTVSYWYRDHKTETIQHETVPVLTFLGRMVQHILPKGFQRIRYYGLHANACYARNRATHPLSTKANFYTIKLVIEWIVTETSEGPWPAEPQVAQRTTTLRMTIPIGEAYGFTARP